MAYPRPVGDVFEAFTITAPAPIWSMTQFVAWARSRKPENNINSNKTNDMKNNKVPEDESDNPKGDPDDETSGEDTLETDGGGEALEGTGDPSKE